MRGQGIEDTVGHSDIWQSLKQEYLKEHSEGSSAHIQLAPGDDARELKEDGEPTSNPNPVISTNCYILQVMFTEHLMVHTIREDHYQQETAPGKEIVFD